MKFNLDDRVKHRVHGEGEVIEIDLTSQFPLLVAFDNGDILLYSEDGLLSSERDNKCPIERI